jgi:uncharacterized protein (TIGR03067 family)
MRVIGLLCLTVVLVLGTFATAEDKEKLEPGKLVGTWTYVSGEKDGKKIPADDLKKGTVEITKENITLKSEDSKFVIKYELDPAKNPCQIKMEITEGPAGQGSKADGIVTLKSDELTLCYPAMGGAVPDSFTAKEGSGRHLFVLKKKK